MSECDLKWPVKCLRLFFLILFDWKLLLPFKPNSKQQNMNTHTCKQTKLHKKLFHMNNEICKEIWTYVCIIVSISVLNKILLNSIRNQLIVVSIFTLG